MKNVAITVAKKQIEQATIAMKPILHNMAEVIQEVQQVKKQLADRLAARDENIRNFFKGEEALISAHVQQLEKDVHQLEDAHALLQQKQEVVQRSVEAFDALQLDGKVNEAGYRYLPPFIKVPPSSLELQALYHTTKPDLYPNATDHVLAKLKGRLATFTSQSATYQQMMEVLAAEKKFLLSFSQQKSIFQSYVQLFIAELQIARRQRALDLDLNVRSKNLDSFRASRLQSLQEIKQKQLAEELEAQRILEEKLKNRQSTLKKVVKNTIKATRQLKKAVNQAIAPDLMEMDDEERKMMANIRERNKEGLGARPECIKSLHFTFNSSEYHYFQKQNLHLAAKGLPYFKPMERSLGNQIFIWMQHTYDDSIFITDIYLSHRQPDNEYHRVFTGKNAYDEVIRNETSELEIYMKRDKLKSKGICNLHLAYTEKDESEFIMNGYTKLEPNLGEKRNNYSYESRVLSSCIALNRGLWYAEHDIVGTVSRQIKGFAIDQH